MSPDVRLDPHLTDDEWLVRYRDQLDAAVAERFDRLIARAEADVDEATAAITDELMDSLRDDVSWAVESATRNAFASLRKCHTKPAPATRATS